VGGVGLGGLGVPLLEEPAATLSKFALLNTTEEKKKKTGNRVALIARTITRTFLTRGGEKERTGFKMIVPKCFRLERTKAGWGEMAAQGWQSSCRLYWGERKGCQFR